LDRSDCDCVSLVIAYKHAGSLSRTRHYLSRRLPQQGRSDRSDCDCVSLVIALKYGCSLSHTRHYLAFLSVRLARLRLED